ncbi:hypothetical protein [Photorhabdus australis]|uniref:hypothetical protein n=1 Tax=Photorhabdus australis TaxID=286156 RepID=UPI0030D99251
MLPGIHSLAAAKHLEIHRVYNLLLYFRTEGCRAPTQYNYPPFLGGQISLTPTVRFLLSYYFKLVDWSP